MRWKRKNLEDNNEQSRGIETSPSEGLSTSPDNEKTTSTQNLHSNTEEVGFLEKEHQWDPNLPLEKLEELKKASKAGNVEAIQEIQRDFIDNSPYEEVRAAVRNTDDGSVANTVRAWVLGLSFVTVIAGINMFLSMRQPAITVPTVVVILLVYPIGELWARVVPMKKFHTFGINWTFNPGPWTIKEHTVVTLMANVTSGYPYSTNALEALQAKSLYNHNMGWGTECFKRALCHKLTLYRIRAALHSLQSSDWHFSRWNVPQIHGLACLIDLARTIFNNLATLHSPRQKQSRPLEDRRLVHLKIPLVYVCSWCLLHLVLVSRSYLARSSSFCLHPMDQAE
jgi:OPT oligopeptide transporter protein